MINFQIKTCPFCGGTPQVDNCADYSVIFCISCRTSSRENRKTISTPERIRELLVDWNNRIRRMDDE